jgi:ABC-type bacteriocin/lantibiotic exporter with double-glycine peptidase domain
MPQRLFCIVCLCGFIFAATPGIWLDVPFIRQEKDGCGAASIAMVMQYWRRQQAKEIETAADAEAIQHALFSSKDHGIRASEMERYFQENGFQTFAFTGKWDDFKQHLEKGRPLIVALKPSTLEASLHYVVVVGVDPAKKIVYVNDAAQRKLLKQDRADFEKQWGAVGRWTLLALPK